MNNTLNNRFLGLPLTGFALIGFAATSMGLLIFNSLIPLLDGSLQAELFSGVEGAVATFVTAVFAAVIALAGISYLLMALLGVNAVRLAKDPDGVKARTGLAKFLVFIGIVSLVFGVTAVAEGATFPESFSILFPAVAQISFAASYLAEAKTANSEIKACA